MARVQRITPLLWFDDQAEAAAEFYTSVFPNSRINQVSRYTEAGRVMQAMLKMKKLEIELLRRVDN